VTGLSTELNMPVDDLLAAPYRLVIREDVIDKLAPLLPRLHETTE
jgi:hypothetical protein